MMKKLGIVVAAIAALAVVFVGANGYACGKSCGKTAQAASNKGTCDPSKCSGMSGQSCSASCKMKGAQMSSAAGGACSAHASDWTSVLSEGRGYYGANVYDAHDGHAFAVFHGQKFEVTDKTPYMQVGNARYFFPTEKSKIECNTRMANEAPALEQETVSLATADGNVVYQENGQKYAMCPVTGRKFVVTADSPVKVVDGRRYYMGQTVDLSTASSPKQN
jgi:hypothetical protein